MARKKIEVNINGTEQKLNSKQVAKAILASKEMKELENHVANTRVLVKPSQEVRDFIVEIANSPDFAEVIAIKHVEKAFIKSLYEKTDMSRAEILYLFAINPNTFTLWRNEEKWIKKSYKKKLDKDRLITLLYHGEYNIIEVKDENEIQMKKKYNAYYYKIAQMTESLLGDSVVDKTTLDAYDKAISIFEKCQKGQYEAKNLAPTIKERTDIKNKAEEMELRKREVEALEKSNNVKVVTQNNLGAENMFTPDEMAKIFKKIISDSSLDDEDKEKLVVKLKSMTGEE